MSNENDGGFDFYEAFEPGNTVDWQEYVREAEKLVGQHAQTGEKARMTLGEAIATNALRRFLDQAKRTSFLQERKKSVDELGIDIDDVFGKNLKLYEEKTKDALNAIGEIDHEGIARLRAFLAELPGGIRDRQNQIFTSLMNEFKNNFILETIRPNQKTKEIKSDQDLLWSIIMGESEERREWYDFVGKLTELDENGKPVVSDELFQNFFEWYQASLAKRQNVLNVDKRNNIADYSNGVKNAVSNGYLPESLVRNLDFFDPESPRFHDLNFALFDMMGEGSSAVGTYFELLPTEREAPIGIRADVDNQNKDGIIWHEFTHAISGDVIDFGDDEANRIVDEALTEHISRIVRSSGDAGMFPDDDDLEFMSGSSYDEERSVVKWLATSGKRTIPPKMFFEAYAEYDPEYEEALKKVLYSEGWEKVKPKVGPKKEALFSALLEAFPECEDVKDLGKLIV